MERDSDYAKPAATQAEVEAAKVAIAALNPDQRIELFREYCLGCGTAFHPCYCQASD